MDVNHLDGNRKTNNHPDNLVWMCPNHHRMYTEGYLDKATIVDRREKYRLPFNEDCKYAPVISIEECGEEDLYDIAVEGPYHNYIANDFVVHNSGMTEDYVKIKNKEKEAEYLHPCLRDILGPTYGCLVYQEQAIRIAMEIAGFSPENADSLRKAIGKKKADLMAEMKKKFIEGAAKVGRVDKQTAEEIFGWIEKSQRYSFNKSHAISYGMQAYATAWAKCHFPVEFFESYLTFSSYKGDPKLEVYQLVQEARFFGISVLPPDIRRCNIDFKIVRDEEEGDCVVFGLSHIRGVGRSAVEKIISVGAENLGTWSDFLKAVPTLHRNVGIALVKSGACDCYDLPRTKMILDIETILGTTGVDAEGKRIEIKGLTSKEKTYFFDQYSKGKESFDILEEMSDKDSDGPPLKTFKKPELLQMIKTRFWDDELNNKANKAELIQVLLDDGYIEPIKVCANDARRQEVAKKAEKLQIECHDTNLGKAAAEKYFLGVSLSCSAVDDVDDHWREDAHHTCMDIARSPSKTNLCACVIIDNVTYTKTKRGKAPGSRMCFVTISDSTYSIPHSPVFPNTFDKISGMCKQDNVVIIHGYKNEKGSFIVNDMQKIM